MTGDRPTTPGWHCHRCRSTSCRQRADSDTDHVGRVEYRPLLLTQPSSVSWLWSHTHWCPSQRPQEVMRVDGSANPTMPKNPAQYHPEQQRRRSHKQALGGSERGWRPLSRRTTLRRLTATRVGFGATHWAPSQMSLSQRGPLCAIAAYLASVPWRLRLQSRRPVPRLDAPLEVLVRGGGGARLARAVSGGPRLAGAVRGRRGRLARVLAGRRVGARRGVGPRRRGGAGLVVGARRRGGAGLVVGARGRGGTGLVVR
mmetsp:Transcript_4742/g.13883  ORF Transcript_4742/g.13883 Transcript_4742/m.13883 type:complete len:257 (-) Transcript_4742:1641-2411(-)